MKDNEALTIKADQIHPVSVTCRMIVKNRFPAFFVNTLYMCVLVLWNLMAIYYFIIAMVALVGKHFAFQTRDPSSIAGQPFTFYKNYVLIKFYYHLICHMLQKIV